MTAVEPTTNPRPAPPATHRSRRDLLCGLAVALAAPTVLVAACGSDSGDSGGDSGTDSGGGPAAPTPLADIPDGGGILVDNPAGGKALLTRDGDEVKAFDAACPHQGSLVAAPENGVITCPSHGSQFDSATGAVRTGPADRPLAELTVTVDGDKVSIS